MKTIDQNDYIYELIQNTLNFSKKKDVKDFQRIRRNISFKSKGTFLYVLKTLNKNYRKNKIFLLYFAYLEIRKYLLLHEKIQMFFFEYLFNLFIIFLLIVLLPDLRLNYRTFKN